VSYKLNSYMEFRLISVFKALIISLMTICRCYCVAYTMHEYDSEQPANSQNGRHVYGARAAWLPTSCLVVQINKPEWVYAHDTQCNLQNVSYRCPYETSGSLIYLIITHSHAQVPSNSSLYMTRSSPLPQIPQHDTTLRQENTNCKIILHQ
jgi:hypothetical protein